MEKRDKIYTVMQINSLVKATLVENMPERCTVMGQITDFKVHQSGHCYFSLKDETAKLPCVMWKSRFNKIKFEMENGMAVLASGFIDVYVPLGRYKFMIGKLTPAGVGALQVAFEQMVERLQTEGLFEDAHKKPLPPYPEKIGILTSETGAAVADIQKSIHDRWPCTQLFLYPVPVQGEGAAQKIAAALRDINKRNDQLKLELLIVGRGGGSLEDLWAFNEEVLARAIFDSAIPVISAVGHEVDTTIADLVADARASTPTKAGVAAVPDMREVLEKLGHFEKNLLSKTKWKLESCQQNLQTILASSVFRNPLLPILGAEQQLDEIIARLADSIKQVLANAKDKVHSSYDKIASIEPHRLLGKKTMELNNLKNRVLAATAASINNARLQLTAKANRLAALNPKSVLQRGYSITTNKKTGLLVKNVEGIRRKDLLITELADENFIESKVTNTEYKK